MKKDGSIRVCANFSVDLNRHICVDKYPLPRKEELLSKLAGGKKFSVIDLASAYLQMPVSIVSAGCHSVLPQGPAIWQRTMEQILVGVPGVSCSLDDIIVTGKSDDEHIRRLETIFEKFRENGLKLKMEECKFFQEKVEYCGIVITENGVEVAKSKTEALKNMPRPTNVTELRCFCGLISYYRSHIQDLAIIIEPLFQLQKKGEAFSWSEVHEKAFIEAKRALGENVILTHFDEALPLSLDTDASAYGIGAVLSHVFPDGSERPIAFASRVLTSAERNYSVIEKEALAIVWAAKKFITYPEGRHFVLHTDHKPLVALFDAQKGIPETVASRIQRWAIYLAGLSYTISYRKSDKNANADALLRLPMSDTFNTNQNYTQGNIKKLYQLTEAITIDAIEKETESDVVLSEVIRQHKNDWREYNSLEEIKPYWRRRQEISMEGKILVMGDLIIMPASLQKNVPEKLHEGHLGISKCKALARYHVWWSGIDEDIQKIVLECSLCQLEKRKNSPKVPVIEWEKTNFALQRVHIDFAGPIGGKILLVLVDHFTRWPEVAVINASQASDTVEKLKEIFARIGLPQTIVSDNGPQFISDCFNNFTRSNNIKHIKSPPFHPATNGLAERFIQTLKVCIGKEPYSEIHRKISEFLFSYPNAPHQETRSSPAELFYGRPLRTWLDNLSNASSKKKLGKKTFIVEVEGQLWHRHINQMLRIKYPIQEMGENYEQYPVWRYHKEKTISNPNRIQVRNRQYGDDHEISDTGETSLESSNDPSYEPTRSLGTTNEPQRRSERLASRNGGMMLDQYYRMVAKNLITYDPFQVKIIEKMHLVGQEFRRKSGVKHCTFWLIFADSEKGFYIFGGSGTGKTVILDMFHHSIKHDCRSLRIHWDSFIPLVQQRIHQYQNSGSVKPFEDTADSLSNTFKVLCLDEIQRCDPANYRLVSNLFSILFRKGTVLVGTSNRETSEIVPESINVSK
ncbi:Transposon Ty3-G Gag-Pol polyprotein [Thelohanellus kitauei]|uniref:Transposon Ty3-G Gag-Pol polyprotein n=1 Tax=Thelohanellus kitauei TaxID=669202 RepID=A0A0C2JFE8_THEKT|nr:Transposon Ty3-G Gag-Pol polyprotein [Thelohanellus kitauei]